MRVTANTSSFLAFLILPLSSFASLAPDRVVEGIYIHRGEFYPNWVERPNSGGGGDYQADWDLPLGPTQADFEAWIGSNTTAWLESWGEYGYGNTFEEFKRSFEPWGGYENYVNYHYQGDAFQMIVDYFGWPPNEGMFEINEPTTPEQWAALSNRIGTDETDTLWRVMRHRGESWWEGVGKNFDWTLLSEKSMDLSNLDFRDSNLTREVISNASSFYGSNLSGINLQGINLSGKWMVHSKLSNTGITPQDLLPVNDLTGIDLSNNDLTGFSLYDRQSNNRQLRQVNLVGTNLTGANLTGATSFHGANLSYLDLSGFVPAVTPSILGTNFTGATNIFSMVNAATNMEQVNLSGHNLSAFNPPSNHTLNRANLSNTTGTPLSSIVRARDFNGIDLRGAKNADGSPITKAQLQAAYNSYWASQGTRPTSYSWINWTSVRTDS